MMYPHFIELHGLITGQKLSVNIENLVMFGDGQIICTNMDWSDTDAPSFRVAESYDEIKKLIEDSGCLIQMGDPRLDNQPLKMEQLKDMIGEPVWDSNKQAWGLVCDQFDGLVRIRGCKSASYDYNADDLARFPVYRMKGEG